MKSKWFRLSLVLLVVVIGVMMVSTTWGAKKYTDDPKKAHEVSWYMVGDPQPDSDAVCVEANKYLKNKLSNTTLKMYHYDWGTWFGRIPTMIAASEPFDIFFVAEWLKYWDWYNQGALLPLNDMLSQYAPKTKKALGTFHLQGSAIDGVNYAVPVKKELSGSLGFLFNKKLIDKYKFDVNKIQKPEDLNPWFETILKNEPETVVFWPTSFGIVKGLLEVEFPTGEFNPAIKQDGSSKGKFISIIETAEFKRYCDLTYEWAQKGYIPADTDATIMGNKADNGLVFARVDPLKYGKDAEMSNEKVTWIQKEMTGRYIGNGQTGGAMHAISLTSKNPVRCMKVLELANSDVNFANIITFGVKGKHYNMVGNNRVKRIPDSGYNPYVWETCNQFIQYLQESDKDDKWEKMAEFDKSAKASPTLGFRYQKDAMSIELSALENVHNQYKDAVVVGRLDPAEFLPEWISQCKDSGFPAVLKDMQAQYDKWKKSKK